MNMMKSAMQFQDMMTPQWQKDLGSEIVKTRLRESNKPEPAQPVAVDNPESNFLKFAMNDAETRSKITG